MKFQGEKFIEVVDGIEPDAYAAGSTYYSSTIDIKGYNELLVGVQMGDMVATSAVTVLVQEDDNTSFSSATTVTDGTNTATTGALAAGTADNLTYLLSINLTNPNRERYMRVAATVATANSDLGVFVLLLGAQDLPVTQDSTYITVSARVE